MMIYGFRCISCNIQFEVQQNITDEHTARCPECGKSAQRIYYPVGHRWDNPKPLYHEDGSYEEKY